MVSKKLNPSAGWPHECGAARAWVKVSDYQLRVVCSFCRKLIGVWEFTKAEETKARPIPEYTTEQKHDLK